MVKWYCRFFKVESETGSGYPGNCNRVPDSSNG